MTETPPNAETRQPKIVTAAMLVIGNEILSGRTRDANMHYLSGRLTELGIRLMEARVVPDIEAMIVAAVNELRSRYDYVFTSGGIGPTHDDITADSIAKAFGVGIDIHPEARRRLEAHYEPGMLNAARLRMARVPDTATLIDNPVSAAPGFRIGNVMVMAGVPAIFQAMVASVAPTLVGGDRLLSRTIVAQVPEGAVAESLGALQQTYPDVDMGSYPAFRGGKASTAIVLRSTDAGRLEAAASAMHAIFRQLGGEPVENEIV
ncbi:molybdopterin-binding protein [uncultured Ferrovibrio sp.]|jgi:molybdenum cofactor synthesis domain-containing protein|uniref:competence/damage-inducible protein A n=1 Tax=uncultured Ferrovibrio sp. TaxID=1576913 RepID=UPI002617FABA|nr:molybdopterin-binding protein [uncultured Ferrovibrio sp.]